MSFRMWGGNRLAVSRRAEARGGVGDCPLRTAGSLSHRAEDRLSFISFVDRGPTELGEAR